MVYHCTFVIDPATLSTGGRLTGGFDGYSDSNPPIISNGDGISVSVTCSSALPQLTGNFVFSAAKPVRPGGPEAALPSPFTTATNKILCLNYQTIVGPSNSFTFGPITYRYEAKYPEAKNSRYELTFVAANNSVVPPIQWSADPEFDTSGN